MPIQLSKTFIEAHLHHLACNPSKLDRMPQIAQKQKKRAAISGGRPLLEIGMLFQDGQVTARAS
jgi:hypothetical protein